MALTTEQRDKIISMYGEGAKTADITRETGASRSSIYFVLNAEGVTPSRQGTLSRPANVASDSSLNPADHSRLLDWALMRVTELEGEVGRLRERLRLVRRAIEEE